MLNVDDNSFNNQGIVRFEGIVRKYDEDFQFCFYESIGWSNILHTKIPTLFVSLKLCDGKLVL